MMALPALMLTPISAHAESGKTFAYKPGLVEKHLAKGKTVFVDYATDWCTTCARQERIIAELRASNPNYNDNIVFVRVDWDLYASDPVSTSRNIPRRSTLIVLKGGKELGRIVAGTSKTAIKDLLDLGLAGS
jgi:thiol-disulfide isomerase/thioredoxin